MTISVSNAIVWFTSFRLYDTTGSARHPIRNGGLSPRYERSPLPQQHVPVSNSSTSLDSCWEDGRSSQNHHNHGTPSLYNGSTRPGGCFVLDSQEFPLVARNLAESLLIPLVSCWSDIMDPSLGRGDSGALTTTTTTPSVQHVLSIVPYSSTFPHLDVTTEYAVGLSAVAVVAPDTAKTQAQRRRRKVSPTMAPFIVDFMPHDHSRLGRRGRVMSSSSGSDDLLIRAVIPNNKRRTAVLGDYPGGIIQDGGKESSSGVVIWDLTAGFGQDAWLLASKGGASAVHMIERNPIVACLVQDALRRLRVISDDVTGATATTTTTTADNAVRHHQLQKAVALSRILSLEHGDGTELAARLAEARKINPLVDLPDIVYLDPMFPERSKSALVKKNMQLLHSLLGSQSPFLRHKIDPADALRHRLDEEERLLDTASRIATARVVVKRPTSAPPLGTGKHRPSFQVAGPVNRWDVYVADDRDSY